MWLHEKHLRTYTFIRVAKYYYLFYTTIRDFKIFSIWHTKHYLINGLYLFIVKECCFIASKCVNYFTTYGKNQIVHTESLLLCSSLMNFFEISSKIRLYQIYFHRLLPLRFKGFSPTRSGPTPLQDSRWTFSYYIRAWLLIRHCLINLRTYTNIYISFYFTIVHPLTYFWLSSPYRHKGFSLSQQFKRIHILYYYSMGRLLFTLC